MTFTDDSPNLEIRSKLEEFGFSLEDLSKVLNYLRLCSAEGHRQFTYYPYRYSIRDLVVIEASGRLMDRFISCLEIMIDP